MKYIGVLFMFISVHSFSQIASDSWNLMNENSNRLEGKITGTMFYLTAEYNNNFFLLNDWMDGEIVMEDGDVFNGIQIRYLMKDDELVVYNKTQKNLFTADKSRIQSFTIFSESGPRKFVKMNYDGIIPEIRFFEILHEGTTQLLAFRFMVERETALYTDSGGNLKDSYFIPEAYYFLYSIQGGYPVSSQQSSYFALIFRENLIKRSSLISDTFKSALN